MSRRSLVDTSPHREELRHLLIDAQWGSKTVSKYASLRWGEEIPASSIRTWRTRTLRRLDEAGKTPPQWRRPPDDDQTARGQLAKLIFPSDTVPDVLSRRLSLIQLQERRIAIDTEHELGMSKLFVSQAKEIELLNRLYNDVKQDMQDLGLWPTLEKQPAVQVNAYGGTAQAAAMTRPEEGQALASAMPDVDPEVVRQAGRTLVLLRREEEQRRTDDGDIKPTE